MFKKLFKKKPGGTAFGNLLRGASSSISPALGQGANKIEIGQIKTNAELANEAGAMQRSGAADFFSGLGSKALGGAAGTTEGQQFGLQAAWIWIKANVALVGSIIAVVGCAIYYFAFHKKKKSNFRF